MKFIPYIIDNSKTIMVVAIVVLLILLFWNPCNKPGENVAKLKAENQQLKKEVKKWVDTTLTIVRNHYEDIKRWQGMKDLYEVEKKEADSNQKLQQKTIDRLASVIRANTGKPVDSSFVLVSPDYKEACDSLPEEIHKLNRVIAEKDTAINEWTDILAYEVQQRDSTIEALTGQIDKGRDLFAQQSKITEAALKAAKPRGRLLGGIGIIGNQQYLLSGANVKLGYQDKRGKTYLASGHIMKFPPLPNPVIMGELSVLFKF